MGKVPGIMHQPLHLCYAALLGLPHACEKRHINRRQLQQHGSM
jgi:hypothetical protein